MYFFSAKVLYDRPVDIFHTITDREKHDFISKISAQYSEFGVARKSQLNHPEHNENSVMTVLTELVGNQVYNRVPRPGVLFSSTSWTPDEDFQILLSALEGGNFTYYCILKIVDSLNITNQEIIVSFQEY